MSVGLKEFVGGFGVTRSVIGMITRIVACVLTFSIQSGNGWSQNKDRERLDDLLKSIGLSKPALARAPDFSLREAAGGLASVSGNRGSLILLNFWATWCGPCREEMPSMEQLSRSLAGGGFTIMAVNQRESAAQVLAFMRRYGLNFRAPLDTDGRVAAAYRVYGIPMTYLIDSGGQAIGVKSGPRNWAAREIVEVFRKIVADTGSNGAGSIDLEPATALPKTLRAKANGLSLHAAHDEQSAVIGTVDWNEELAPLGKVSGGGEYWYIVKARNGATGWVREVDVEQVTIRK